MTAWHYILRSLRQYRRTHFAVAAGVAVATAVISGALLVGDSMRGSLRGLALRSFDRVDAVLLAEHPFHAKLAEQWLTRSSTAARPTGAPLILTSGSAVFRQSSGAVHRASQLQVIGASPQFWRFDLDPEGQSEAPLALNDGLALSEAIAAELGAKVGDSVLVRLPAVRSVPADSALGEKEENAATRRLRVTAILSGAAFPGRFALRPSQQPPRNVFVPITILQQMLDLDGQANAVAVAGASDAAAVERLRGWLHPALADYGVEIKEISGFTTPSGRYIQVAADRQVLHPALVGEARRLYGDAGLQPVVTYLANTMIAGDRKIPYSTIAGVDSTAELGPVLDPSGKPIRLAADEIALNDWAARNLNANVSDAVAITWYEPETTHGQLREARPLQLKVRAIVPLHGADGNATWAADPNFAPELPGVTDQASINDWDLPFELTETIRDEDEQYWDEYRTAPKGFVSHELAARLWSTRWGTESVLRLPVADSRTAEGVAAALRERLDPEAMGMRLIAVKHDALAAAAGTTPFDGLFLGFSSFLMASAVMLTMLLFRLGVEQRAREIGLLLAVGLRLARLRRLLALEAAIVASMGAAGGAILGLAYARLMVYGLNTWWIDATAAPFLELHVTARSILLGWLAGVAVTLATIFYSLRGLRRLPVRQLLGGDVQPPLGIGGASRQTSVVAPLGCIAIAVALGFVASRTEGEAQAGAFFGGGALVLIGLLLAVRGKLREAIIRPPHSMTLAGLAARNARRNPSRTMLSLGLAAAASFLIVALSAFRLAPSDRGVGGFDLLATADVPVLFDLGTDEGRRELGFTEEQNRQIAGAEVVGFRVHDGQDASCLNLYQPTQPRVLGAPSHLARPSNFLWAAQAELPASGGSDVEPMAQDGTGDGGWALLEAGLGNDEKGRPITPAVLDRNTAYYSLKAGLGKRLAISTSGPGDAQVEVVGLLANSVLQGDVIIGDANFRRLFPEEAGRRFFLIRRGPASPPVDELASLLETQLEDYGFDAVDARQRLGELLAVQNTYLSTFQSLGGLGLLLGVVGMAVVQLRSVIERRGELALLQAAGFRRRRLAAMVLAENLLLLTGGLGIGCAAALAVVVPHAIANRAGTPWGTLTALLAIIVAAGALAAWIASRVVLRAPLVPALRGD
ncbi:MAG: ABC transporter permease [Pirellulales bacterium]|nr:ABC transporter permease [Pirellulales bacterium]